MRQTKPGRRRRGPGCEVQRRAHPGSILQGVMFAFMALLYRMVIFLAGEDAAQFMISPYQPSPDN